MRKPITSAVLAVALGLASPAAFADDGNGYSYGHYKPRESAPAVIEAAAQSLSVVIGVDAGGDSGRYLSYARRLAATLDQKSSAELDVILGSGDHFGLGS